MGERRGEEGRVKGGGNELVDEHGSKTGLAVCSRPFELPLLGTDIFPMQVRRMFAEGCQAYVTLSKIKTEPHFKLG